MIWESHQKKSLVQPRHKHKNYSLTASLFTVPHYPDLLEDQDNEDKSECGLALVTSAAGWQTEMAGWIGVTREADRLSVEENINMEYKDNDK